MAQKSTVMRAALAGLVCLTFAQPSAAQDLDGFIDPIQSLREHIETRNATADDNRAPSNEPRAEIKTAIEPLDAPSSADASVDANPTLDGQANALEQADASPIALSAAAPAAQDTFIERMRRGFSELAGKVGLTLPQFLAALFALMGAILLFAASSFFGGSRRRGLYASGTKGRSRRVIADGHRAKHSDDDAAEALVPAAAAAAVYTPPAASAELPSVPELRGPELELNEPLIEPMVEAPAVPDVAAKAEVDEVKPKSDDPSTWRRPNLDRLRDSIKSDWKASKTADLAVSKPVSVAAVAAAGVANPQGAPTSTGVSWDEWDAQLQKGDDVWGASGGSDSEARVTDQETIKRARALRESLRAS